MAEHRLPKKQGKKYTCRCMHGHLSKSSELCGLCGVIVFFRECGVIVSSMEWNDISSTSYITGIIITPWKVLTGIRLCKNQQKQNGNDLYVNPPGQCLIIEVIVFVVSMFM
jgi:hypothetical protein